MHWFLENIPQLLQGAGIVVGLLFTGLTLRADLKSRHADILIRLTESHRALWIYFDERPELKRVFDTRADVSAQPVTPQEARFIQFFVNHVIVSFQTAKLGLYKSPDMHELDLREFFSRPVPRAAWQKLKRFQDRDFADYMQRIIG